MPSSLSRLIISSSEVWYVERSVLLMLKAGFAMPSAAALSSLGMGVGGQKTTRSKEHQYSDKQKICSNNSFAERLERYQQQMAPKQN